MWKKISSSLQRKVIICYGVSGHGKGLVDAMSGFGVKGPIRNAVIREDFSYSSAKDIHSYLENRFNDDKKKLHHLLSINDIEKRRSTKSSLPIKGCLQYHMLCFSSGGKVTGKLNICSCNNCLEGEFLLCIYEKGIIIYSDVDDSGSETDNDEIDNDEEFEEDDIIDSNEQELYEMRSDSVLGVISRGGVIALY